MADKPTIPGAFTDEAEETEKYLERLAEVQRRQEELKASIEARLKTIKELAPIEIRYLENVNDLLVKEKEELRVRSSEVEKLKTEILKTNEILAKREELEKNAIRLTRENVQLQLELSKIRSSVINDDDMILVAARKSLELAANKKEQEKEIAQSLEQIVKTEEKIVSLELEQKKALAEGNAARAVQLINQQLSEENILAREKESYQIAIKKKEIQEKDLKDEQEELVNAAKSSDEAKAILAKKTLLYIQEKIALEERISSNKIIIDQEEQILEDAEETNELSKEELNIRLHNQRAAEIQEKTQEKLLSIVGKAYKLQDSYLGSFVALTANSEKSINGIFDAFGKQFSNVEVAYGTFFKRVEEGMVALNGKFGEFFNFEKGIILGLDKSAAAFNKATGRGDEFRQVFEKINTQQGISTKEFLEFNVGLDRMQSGFSDAYISYNRFRDAVRDGDMKMQSGFLLTSQKLANVGLSTQKFGSLLTQLGGNLTDTKEKAESFGDMMVQTMLATGKSMESLAGDFETFKDKFVVYGETGKQVFKDLQIMAERMGVSFSSLVGITTAFDKFEDGAKRAGQINAALGGAYINSLDMMALKENERILYLKRSFEQTGMNFNSLNKYSQEFLASSFGIKSVAEAQNLFSMSTARLTAELAERNKKQKELDDIAKGSADVMEQIKLFGESLLIAIGPVFSLLNGFIKTLKDNENVLKTLKVLATIGLTLGLVMKVGTGLISLVGFLKSAYTVIKLMFTGQFKAVADLLQKKQLEEQIQARLNAATTQRLETERRITAEYIKRGQITGLPAGTALATTNQLTPEQSARVVPTTGSTVSPNAGSRFLTGSGAMGTAAGVAGAAMIASYFVEDPSLKKLLNGIASVAGIVLGFLGILAAFAGGVSLAAFGAAILPIITVIGGGYALTKAFDGAVQKPDGTMVAASDYAMSGRPVIPAKNENGMPIYAAMNPKDTPIVDPQTGLTYYSNDINSIIDSGQELIENKVSMAEKKNLEFKSMNMNAPKVEAFNTYSNMATAARIGESNLSLSDEQLNKLASKIADGAQKGIEGARLTVEGSVSVDGKRFGNLVTDVMKSNAFGRG